VDETPAVFAGLHLCSDGQRMTHKPSQYIRRWSLCQASWAGDAGTGEHLAQPLGARAPALRTQALCTSAPSCSRSSSSRAGPASSGHSASSSAPAACSRAAQLPMTTSCRCDGRCAFRVKQTVRANKRA